MKRKEPLCEAQPTNADGSVPISEELRRRWGLTTGSRAVIRETPAGLLISPQDPPLGRVYIEPTTACNLNCKTCMRHSWDEPIGSMDMPIFRRLIHGLRSAPALHTVSFWGMGEPLMHPNIAEMVSAACGLGAETELITNGMLLDQDKAEALIEAGLNRLVVSVDGATPATHSSNRAGSSLELVRSNLAALQGLRRRNGRQNPEVGIEFVMMRRNISEVPKLRTLAYELGAAFIILTNVLPYTEELKDEILYHCSVDGVWPRGMSTSFPGVTVPRIDARPENLAAINQLLWFGYAAEPVQKMHRKPDNDGHCPFVEQGSMVLAWDGEVSPCVALMHSYRCYVMGREKLFKRYTLGNIREKDILSIWEKPEFADFRRRVLDFDFPPCVNCGGCQFSETNEEDCFGNPFPVCGDCLWARNVIVCP
ncbi:MAG: radical SAM protein [Desulfohalobiaceae bacterium]|nr:radical SAM protein [Desulfohalobiaceae bacterium]